LSYTTTCPFSFDELHASTRQHHCLSFADEGLQDVLSGLAAAGGLLELGLLLSQLLDDADLVSESLFAQRCLLMLSCKFSLGASSL
jgi:hypothetical protein